MSNGSDFTPQAPPIDPIMAMLQQIAGNVTEIKGQVAQLAQHQMETDEKLISLEAKAHMGGGMAGMGFGFITEDVAQAMESQQHLAKQPAKLIDGMTAKQAEALILDTPLGAEMPKEVHRGVIVLGNTSGRSRVQNGEFSGLFTGE